MIFFNKRKEIQEEYEKWLKDNPDVRDCVFNVITFLESKHWLDENKIIEDLGIGFKN